MRKSKYTVKTHGLGRHGVNRFKGYSVWLQMNQRCRNPKTKNYNNYGGRGIQICEGFRSFPTYHRIMQERPSPKHSIDRVNNEGHYSCGECRECVANHWPLNLRWATKAEQVRNMRRNHFITFNNQTLCITDWAISLGLKPNAMYKRLARWPLDRALTTPNLGATHLRTYIRQLDSAGLDGTVNNHNVVG